MISVKRTQGVKPQHHRLVPSLWYATQHGPMRLPRGKLLPPFVRRRPIQSADRVVVPLR